MVFLNIALGILLFAAATYAAIYLGKRICGPIEPFADGPAPGTPPVKWMFALSALTGALVGWHAGSVELAAVTLIGLSAVLSGCFMSAWYCDTRCGIVPDWFTLPPLVVILIWSLVGHNFITFITAGALFVPFAFTAYRSKGLGMGWGDAKLVALGGAALGGTAFLSTILACLVMAVYAKMTKRMNEPIAFAPYLVVGFECSLAFLRM